LQENPIIKKENFKEISIFNDSVKEFLLQEEEYLPHNNYKTLLLKQLKELCRQ